MVTVNYLAVLACAVLSMIIGTIWYGPMFGKKWMQITGSDKFDEQKRKEMQKSAMPLYGIQFVLSLIQAYILAQYVVIGSLIDISGVMNGFLIWLAFVMPTVAGSSMWNANSNKIKWAQFYIQAGYQLVLFLVFGALLIAWK
jgi:hypothetical protein